MSLITTLNAGQIFCTNHENPEKKSFTSFRAVAENFLENFKAPNYRNFLKQLLNFYEQLGCNMCVKLHLLHSRANYFSENLGYMSEEQSERFQLDVKTMEKKYRGRWNTEWKTIVGFRKKGYWPQLLPKSTEKQVQD